MSIFENKNQRRKFDKLGNDAKKEAMNVAIQNEFWKVLANRVSQAMVDGMDLQNHHLYKKYVSEIDSGRLSGEEEKAFIEKLLSAIRIGHTKYVKNHTNSNEKIPSSRTEENVGQ